MSLVKIIPYIFVPFTVTQENIVNRWFTIHSWHHNLKNVILFLIDVKRIGVFLLCL